MQRPIHTRGVKRFYWGESRDLSEKDIFSANKNWQCRTDSNRAGKSREVIKQQGNTSDSVEHRCVGTFIFSYEGASGGEK